MLELVLDPTVSKPNSYKLGRIATLPKEEDMSEKHKSNRNTGGRGHHLRPVYREHIYAPPGGISKFSGLNPKLSILDFGSIKNNKPIQFPRLLGEHCAVTFKASISEAFLSVPPEYGTTEEEPIYPEIDPDKDLNHIDRAQISVWINAQKNWASEQIRIQNDKLTAFSVVYGQLLESSRCEVEDHGGWTDAFRSRDLIYFITRIRATHIALQSGNISLILRVRIKQD